MTGPQRELEPLDDPGLFGDSTFDLGAYIHALYAKRWLIAVLGIVLGAYGVYGALRQVPVYRATARLLIEPAPAVLGLNDLVRRNQANEVDRTQLQLLESRNFKIQVIDNYGLLPAARQLSGPSGEGTAPSTAEPIDPPTPSLWARATGFVGSLSGRLRSVLAPPSGNRLDPAILPEHMRNDRYAGPLAQFSAMRVNAVANTNIVEISWTSRDRVFATRMANAVATEFVEYSRNTQAETSADASEFLTQEIDRLQLEIQQEEAEAAAIADRLGVTDLSSVTAGSGGALTSQLASARADRVQKEAVYRQIQNASAGSIAEVRGNPDVRQARSEVDRIQGQLDDESERFTQEHPRIKELQDDLAEARADLQREQGTAYDAALLAARNAYNAAASAESRLENMVAGQRNRSAQDAEAYADLGILQSGITNKRRALQQFIDQRENMSLSARLYGARGPTAKVIDWATLPQVPAGTALSRVFLYHAAIGVLLGCLIALALDFLDNTLRTPDDVSRRVGLSTLGTVTSLDAATKGRSKYYSRYSESVSGIDASLPAELVAEQQPRSVLAEEYRELRTALLLSTAGGAPRRLALTSSQPGEGKTTTTCNLAISLAHAGKKVLLIDGDMRRPRLDGIFERANKPGLANYLAGSGDWESFVLDSPVKNLWLLPSGPVPPNPAELFAGELYGELVDQAQTRFDIIVVDTPPLEPVVDALMIAQHADGVILVVRAGETPHQAVSRARRKLEQMNGRILGVVLNGIRPTRVGGNYYSPYAYSERRPQTRGRRATG